MSVNYHVNPETGRVNICRADPSNPKSRGCDFKENGVEPPHFTNKDEAHAYKEELLSKKHGTTATMSKKPVKSKTNNDNAPSFSSIDYDIDSFTQDERWFGFGYLRERQSMSKEMRDEADKMVTEQSDKLGLYQAEVFDWANSKIGRWYGESFIMNGSDKSAHLLPTSQYDRTKEIMDKAASGTMTDDDFNKMRYEINDVNDLSDSPSPSFVEENVVRTLEDFNYHRASLLIEGDALARDSSKSINQYSNSEAYTAMYSEYLTEDEIEYLAKKYPIAIEGVALRLKGDEINEEITFPALSSSEKRNLPQKKALIDKLAEKYKR